MRRLAPLVLLATAAACHQAEPTPTPTPTPTAVSPAPAAGDTASSAPTPATPAAATSTPAASATPDLDARALNERKDPDRLLAYLAEAIDAGRWDDAAKAWHDTSTAAVKTLFGAPSSALVTFGKGDSEGAAGSIYYTAPVLLLTHGGQSHKEGTITLRRVNDVPGAEPWQLAWHVEGIEWKD